MKISALLLICMTMLVSACGRPASKATSRLKQKISPEQVQALIQDQNITCASNGACPQGIGRMFAVNYNDAANSSMCSVFLVGPDLVMTNSHCVYTGKIGLKKTCEGLYFVFPGDQNVNHVAGCSEIIWRDRRQHGQEHPKLGDNDFALVRLDQPIPHTPLVIRKGGMKKGMTVYPFVIDHINASFAKVTKLSCKVKHVNAKFGVVTLKDCPIISGNSGSAVLDQDNNVIGIIFASSNNNIRLPTDATAIRTKSKTEGFAYSMDQVKKILGPTQLR